MKSIISLFTETDSILKASYTMIRVNALELSVYLKTNISEKGLDYNEYNSHMDSFSNKVPKKPIEEIYEYQNFFLLEKEGEYILLDGFRRLLWYPAPDIFINVRVYKYDDLTSSQILSLLLDLNHTKTTGNSSGKYHDRGFALALEIIFNLHIHKYSDIFDNYLSKSIGAKDYSYSSSKFYAGSDKENRKTKITNSNFITDLKFIEAAIDSGLMVNDYFAALVYQISTTKILPSFEVFYNEVKNNNLLMDLLQKRANQTNDAGGHMTTTSDKIIEIYKNIFNVLNGEESKLTYAEKVEKFKKDQALLKKDKNYTKLTGINGQEYVGFFHHIVETRQVPDLKLLVHPDDRHDGIGYGLITDWKFKIQIIKGKFANEIGISVIKDDIKIPIENKEGRWGVEKRYVLIKNIENSPYDFYSQKIELYVKLTNKELDELAKDYHSKNSKNIIKGGY